MSSSKWTVADPFVVPYRKVTSVSAWPVTEIDRLGSFVSVPRYFVPSKKNACSAPPLDPIRTRSVWLGS